MKIPDLIDFYTFKKMAKITGILLLLILLYVFFQVYIPVNPISHETITYKVQKGWGNDDIAKDLKNLGMIRSSYFFQIYTIISFNHTELQAGRYTISQDMSVYKIVKKMARGDTLKDRFVIYEGWTVADIGEYFQSRNLCTKEEFIKATEVDYSREFKFLIDKPENVGLEGYLFPDTYEITEGETCQNIIKKMLANFETKLTPDLEAKIQSQQKTIFEVITMASLLEKEVKTLEDKKIVSGILEKRLSIGMALQLDSTVNYATGKSSPSVSIKDTKINSPYNTYKYPGLPKGPISNPGVDSIIATLEPTKTDYLYYLSASGKTYFAKTLQEHATNKAKYLR
jgi:UPF0755 protein